MKILIVDDNIDSVEYMSRILDGNIAEVIKAYDGSTAISLAKKALPDIILLDVMMPDINGFEVCEKLTRTPVTSEIPIIMVTAKTEAADLERGLEAGAHDYVKKPFEPNELLARVRSAMRFKRSRDELLEAKKRLEEMNEELAHLAVTDSLTQTYNHTFLVNTLRFELGRSERFSKKMAFLMIDIDFFKKINDTYGHLVGDEVLREVVKITQTPIRSIDILGRYGGEEFGLILPETNEEGAMILAEKIRKNIQDHSFIVKSGKDEISIKLTVSIGVSIYPGKNITDIKSLIKNADDALYTSKRKGRNKVYMID